jgi:hypothetical protein
MERRGIPEITGVSEILSFIPEITVLRVFRKKLDHRIIGFS